MNVKASSIHIRLSLNYHGIVPKSIILLHVLIIFLVCIVSVLFCSPPVSMEELLDAASTRLPTLRGLKYTDYDLMELGRCLSGNGGKYQILYGRDEVRMMLLSCLKVAAAGS